MTLRLSAVLFLSVLVAPLAWGHPGPGIVVNAKGEVYFVDPSRSRIMKVDAAGKMTVFVESKETKNLFGAHHLVMDKKGNLYSVSDEGDSVWKITPDGKTTAIYTPGPGQEKLYVGANGFPFTVDADGNLYFVPGAPPNSMILKLSPDGKVTNFAGGIRGFADGKGDRAQFRNLYTACFAWGPKGELYLTDDGNSVRKIAADGTVTTIAGGAEGGYADGAGKAAKFGSAHGVTCDAEGNLFVAEVENRRIRKITPDGKVTTLAGLGKIGTDDGPAPKATFQMPVGVAVSKDGTVYVLEYGFAGSDPVRVRKISPEGNVTTVAIAGGNR